MRYFNNCILASIMLLIPICVQANPPLLFQRDTMDIIPAGYVAAAEDKTEETTQESTEKEVQDDTSKETQPDTTKTRVPITINVEMRSEEALALEWIDSLNYLRDKNGVAIILQHPGDVPIIQSPIYKSLDLICIAIDGNITRIYPALVLATLQTDIRCGNNTKAYLYLPSDFTKTHNILPKDRAAHPVFIRAPTIIQ